jgi:hypothetical protein
MKNPLSTIMLLSGLILINVVWPMKAKYVSFTEPLIFATIGIVIFIIIHLKLRECTKTIVFYSNQSSETSNKGIIAIGYLGFITGLYLGYNYSVFQYFENIEMDGRIILTYIVSLISSIICYLILTIFENSNYLRLKYHIIYGPEWDLKQLFMSGFVNITISEFAGIAFGFYCAILIIAYELFANILGAINIYIAVGIIFLVLLCSAAGFIFFRYFNRKLKA